MGFRFRKSVKLGKGVKLNLGKKSAGVSFGGKHGGISINSKSGARGRVSIPGTGVSYSTKLSGGKSKRESTSRHTAMRTSTSTPGRASAAETPRGITPVKKAKNPPKPPKSPKVYLPCGIVMIFLGFLLLFLLWPLGIIAIGIGIYYVVCGPKIYADLVKNYKKAHPNYKENA